MDSIYDNLSEFDFIVQIACQLIDGDHTDDIWVHGIRHGLKWAGKEETARKIDRKFISYIHNSVYTYEKEKGCFNIDREIVVKWVSDWLGVKIRWL